LNTYIHHIIEVLNQHAKLLNDHSLEIQQRPREATLNDLLTIAAKALPVEKIEKKSGGKFEPVRFPNTLKAVGEHSQSIQLKGILQSIEKLAYTFECVGKCALDAYDY